MSDPSVLATDRDDPLTAGELRRVGDALATVSTQTLLQSLVALCRMSEDGKLIIAELIDRLPAGRANADPPR